MTLVGPGGVGKTRLARRAGLGGQDGPGCAPVFVELAGLTDGALLPEAVARRLRLARPALDLVLDALHERDALLVLDNCEHLVDACAEFADAVLRSCPGARVLATSREPLGVYGEHVLAVGPLPAPPPDALSAADLDDCDAVRLFLDRASAVLPSMRIGEDGLVAVGRLCRRLEGLPLAIELAAARLRVLSPRQIDECLANSFDVLTGGGRTVPERHRTLRAAFDWSHGLCTEAEHAVWARLSVFRGSFCLDAAVGVCAGEGVAADTVLDVVDSLLGKSVLTRADEDSGESAVARYRMLEPLRQYGQERLTASGDRARVARLRLDRIDRLTAQADADWPGPRQRDWIALLGREDTDLRAALESALAEPGESAVALRIAARLPEYWRLRGLSNQARRWLERALAATAPDCPGRVYALGTAALHALWQADLDGAQALLDQAGNPAVDDGDDLLLAHVISARSLHALLRGDPRAAALAATAARIFGARGLRRGQVYPLLLHGVATALAGDLSTGRAAIHQVTMLCESGCEGYRPVALFGLATLELLSGDTDRAAEAAGDGLVHAEAIDSPFDRAYFLEVLAWVASSQYDHRRAARLFGAAAGAWARLGVAAERAVPRQHREHVDRTRAALGAEPFTAAFGEGRAMTVEQARDCALAPHVGNVGILPEPRSELTKRELEITGLIAQGLTNRDIAAALFISPRTATTHVQNILGKLGMANRAQIAVWTTTQRET
ncbi:LuxR C-terminal-related transcriptional regulator [Actinokineospora sp. PR83]|uniref:ATP-binding protein n=1 Tax=Actinokineospora sp. PR83 TaxID=2884908 RepID=UPI0027DF5B1C|nr:LuxR C-terminal-related transcriptional regulator [Actinokineospora sp. PR83]MCG8920407.1 LuxR C-terminal-related transcriptional regulator [Actinokineospora sp. PR83]